MNKPEKFDLPNTLTSFAVQYNPIWIKFARVDNITFVGKEAVAISNGCMIIFKSLPAGEEQLLHCNGREYGEGVSTMAGHKTQPMFAYTEMREYPRLFVLVYPALTKAIEMTSQVNSIVALGFSEGDLLFGVSGYPECAIVTWRWRTGEHLSITSTSKLFSDCINIKCNYNVSPSYVSILVSNTKDLSYWVAGCVGRKCLINELPMTCDNNDLKLRFSDAIWSNDGFSYAIDCSGNVYKYDFHTNRLITIISCKDFQGPGIGAFCWFKNGLAVHTPDNVVRHYTKENWELSATLSSGLDFITFKSRPSLDYIIGKTKTHHLLFYDPSVSEFKLVRGDEAGITHFGLVPPLNVYIITLSRKSKLSLWHSNTGNHIQTITFDSEALSFRCNRLYPYVALGFITGHMHFYSCVKGILEPMCHFYLAPTPINKVKLFEFDRIITGSNMDNGQIFIVEGEPGQKFKVLSYVNYGKQIVDFFVVGAHNCLKLFLLPVTTKDYFAGNIIVRYCIVRHEEATVKVFELENPERLYIALYPSIHQELRDRRFYAAPFDSKNLHELQVKRGDTYARIINRIKSYHMMRLIFYKLYSAYICSFGYDGLFIMRDTSFVVKLVVSAHHRMTGGISSGMFDPNNHRLVTLGRDGTLQCGEVPGNPLTTKEKAELFAHSQELHYMFKQPSIGFDPKGPYEGMCWLEYQKDVQREAERVKYAKQRGKLIKLMQIIKKEANVLLDHNLSGPPEERLDLQEFNLNLQHKEDVTKANKEQCEEMKQYLERLIKDQDRVFNLLKAEFWDSIDEPTKNLWAIFGNFNVPNYCKFIMNIVPQERLDQFAILREVEHLCASDISRPWDLVKSDKPKSSGQKVIMGVGEDEGNALYGETTEEALQKQIETQVAFHGTATPMYIDIGDLPYPQLDVQTFYQREITRGLSLEHQQGLREVFNSEFAQMAQTKVTEMGMIAERNARLRYIISELNHFSPIEEHIDIRHIDPEWRQDEDPILLTQVENSEVGILPYLSPSEQQFLATKAAEEERLRLLLLADDFKERALMKMMNGVLEVRWEDELRMEIPKPKCMVEKKVANYTEDDLRQIKEYEAQTVFLNSERERYKVSLRAEYVKTGNMLREGVKKFNEALMQLFARKIEIESAHRAENLRIERMRIRGMKIKDANTAEQHLEQNILQNELEIETVSAIIASLSLFDHEVRVNLEAALGRDRNVDKTIKREMQDYTHSQTDRLAKLLKKRPKMSIKLFNTPNTLTEMAKAVQTQHDSPLLTGDAIEYVKMLHQMDKFGGLPPMIDEAMFDNVCRLRRLKIESELKLRASQLEIHESDATQHFLRHRLSKLKATGSHFLQELERIREQAKKDSLDIEIQLSLKQAFVELPRTGFVMDFQDAILVNRKDVEDINELILQAGSRKIKAMKHAMQYRKAIMIKEWQHERKKMEIADFEHTLVEIRSLKVTKEIQQLLKQRKRGGTEKSVTYEEELASMQNVYWQQCQKQEAELNDLIDTCKQYKADNEQLNKAIIDLNIDVNEAKLDVDHSLSEKENKFNQMRARAYLKRSKMVHQIQKNHAEILTLQAQLEICRLKTIPILDYKLL